MKKVSKSTESGNKKISKHSDSRNRDTILQFLNESYNEVAKYVEGERNRTLNMQTFIGEAVIRELLNQSYGIPEYSIEEKLKRFIACVIQAIESYHRARNNYAELKNRSFENLWTRPEDPHSIEDFNIDSKLVKIPEIPVSRPDKEIQVSLKAETLPEPSKIQKKNIKAKKAEIICTAKSIN